MKTKLIELNAGLTIDIARTLADLQEYRRKQEIVDKALNALASGVPPSSIVNCLKKYGVID